MGLISATFSASLAARQTGPNDFDAGGEFTPKLEQILHFTNGILANQCDILWTDERQVADGGNDDIDLFGVLSDAYGSTISAAELCALIVINAPRVGSTPNTTNLTLGSAAAPVPNISSGAFGPGGIYAQGVGDAAGLATITDTTADTLRVANSAGAIATYQIGMLARTA